MIKADVIVFGLFLAAMLAFAPNAEAQFPAPPQIGVEPPQPELPGKDTSAEVEKMTKRYGLSDDQTKNVRTILEEQARKANDVVKNDSLAPDEKIHRMLAIKDQEITRVSDALTPEQRKKYLADVRPTPPQPESPAGGGVSSGAAKE